MVTYNEEKIFSNFQLFNEFLFKTKSFVSSSCASVMSF